MICLFISNIIAMIIIFFAYRSGVRDGQDISNKERIRNRKDEESEEEKKIEQNNEILMQNIENYDGTEKRQKDFII